MIPFTKKLLSVIVFFLMVMSTGARAAADINLLLKKGINSLTVAYDAVNARKLFKEALDDPDAGEEIIIHSYFWLAYSYLFEGRNDDARKIFTRIFRYKSDPDHKFESVLDEALISNGELMRMYDVEFEKFFGRPRVLIEIEKKKNKFSAGKKIRNRGMIIGGIVTLVIILSFL